MGKPRKLLCKLLPAERERESEGESDSDSVLPSLGFIFIHKFSFLSRELLPSICAKTNLYYSTYIILQYIDIIFID